MNYRELNGTNSGARNLAEWIIPFGEVRPILTSQMSYLQLVGSSEAILFGIIGHE